MGVHTATMATRTRTVEEPQSSRSHIEIHALLGVSTYLVPEYPKEYFITSASCDPYSHCICICSGYTVCNEVCWPDSHGPL